MKISITQIVHPDTDLRTEMLQIGQECPEFIGFWDSETILRLMTSKDGLCLVARDVSDDKRKLVGFSLGTYQPITRKFQWENMWVDPNYRNLRIARSFTTRTIESAKVCGANLIVADVFSNVASKILEKHFGFKKQGSFHYLRLTT